MREVDNVCDAVKIAVFDYYEKAVPAHTRRLAERLCVADGKNPDVIVAGPTSRITDLMPRWARYRRLAEAALTDGDAKNR